MNPPEVQNKLKIRFELSKRSWLPGEVWARLDMIGEFKGPEIIGDKILATDEQLLALVGLLIENLGLAKVVHLGDPAMWRQALAALEAP